jgi:excisionase family DNA binding protein
VPKVNTSLVVAEHLRALGFTKVAYSVDEVCALVPLGRTAIYELIKAGKLKPIKIGRRTALRAVDIAALIASPEEIADTGDKTAVAKEGR